MRLLTHFTRYAIICLALTYGVQNEAQAKEKAGFCWVPIINGEPTEADIDRAFRTLGTKTFQIPGLPGPVFTPHNRDGVWIITPEGRYEEFEGEFPSLPYDDDNWVHEPENSRVIAANNLGAEYVLQLRTGDASFQAIPTAQIYRYEPDEPPEFGLTEFFRLTKPPQTLVQTCHGDAGCKLQQLQGETLIPWLDDTDAETFGGRWVRHIEKTADNRITFVVLSLKHQNNSLIYASLDGQPYKFVAELCEGYVFNRERMGPSDFTFATSSRVIYVYRDNDGMHHDVFDVGRNHRISGPTEAGVYNRWVPKNFLSRPLFEYLEPGASTWEPVTGLEQPLSERPFPFRAATIGTYYFKHSDGLYLFDGKIAQRVTLNGQHWARAQFSVEDAATLDRLLAFTETEIFEVTDNAVLRRIYDGSVANIDPYSAKDDPYLGAVTFRSNGRLHALWPDFTISELIEIVQEKIDPQAPRAPLDVAPWPGVNIETKDNRLWLRINLDRKHAPSCGVGR